MKRLVLALFASLLFGSNAKALEDGTLIFLENSKWIVEQYTDSPTCHVAVVVNENGVPWVYEAEPPCVRRLKLSDYYDELARLNKKRNVKIKMFVLRPSKNYSKLEIAEMKKFVDSEVGRRYSIKGIVRKRPSDGTHCSQLACNFLNTSSRFDFARPYTISPALLRSLVDSKYKDSVQVFVKAEPKLNPAKKTWYQRSWAWCGHSSTWCGWSCEETWKWCW